MATQSHPAPVAPNKHEDPHVAQPEPGWPPRSPEDLAKDKEKLELQKLQAGPPVETVADEQRKRSEEMEKEGVDKWIRTHNPGGAPEPQKQVPGVARHG